LCYTIDKNGLNACVQDKKALKCAKIVQIKLGILKMWAMKYTMAPF